MSGYSTGDVELKLSITSGNVTIDYIVKEAGQMWKEMKRSGVKFGDIDASEKLMSDITKRHPDFCKSYPIVCRYICQMQEYDTRAFRRWLIKIKEHPWKTEAEYLDAQADYVAILFKVKKPRSNRTEINNLRTNIRAMLEREHIQFKKYATEFEKEVTGEEGIYKEKNMDELQAFAELAGSKGISLAETIRSESEVSSVAFDIDKIIGDRCSNITDVLEYTADDLLS